MAEGTQHWTGAPTTEVVDLLTRPGGMAVTPTKVGYVVMVSDGPGLERKFEAKNRNRTKPGVVLCGTLDEVRELAQLNPEIDAFYQRHWDDDILLGCILPWRDSARAHIPQDGSDQLMMDRRGTSCFVIRFGTPSEQIARTLWEEHGRLAFASSANPSGHGNRGLVSGIGERIRSRADLIVEADDYVHSIQPHESEKTRYEQGVMVSMVDADGRLVPEQHGRRSVTPAPTLIRRGLDADRIMAHLSDIFPSWDHRQGEYY